MPDNEDEACCDFHIVGLRMPPTSRFTGAQRKSLPTVRHLRRRCHVARGDFGTSRADQDKSPCPAATARRMENCDCNQFADATGEPPRNSAGEPTSQPDRIWREAATRFDRWPKFRRFIGRAPATARHSVRDDLSRRWRTCTGRETGRTAGLAAGRRAGADAGTRA